MKKLLAFMLAFVMVLSMSISAFAAEVSDGTVLVKTWENDAGETVTGIITRGSSVLDACTSPEGANEARGFITDAPEDAIVTYSEDDDITPYSEVSDYFYMQIYNSRDVVVSKYKVTLTGSVGLFSKKITSVSFSRVSGDTCTTEYDIDGNTAYVKITHPVEGYFDAYFTLNSSGEFVVS